MKVLGLEFHFNKNVITRVIMLFLPMAILASVIFLYILPTMRKSIIQEYEGINKNLLDFVNVQFTQIDEIKANMEKKNFVNRLLYVDSDRLYDKNSDVSDFLDFIDELYNINEISSITSDIGIYNKKMKRYIIRKALMMWAGFSTRHTVLTKNQIGIGLVHSIMSNMKQASSFWGRLSILIMG